MQKNTRKTTPVDLLSHVPPQDIMAEQSLLSAIFMNNKVLLDVIELVSESDFYKGAHQKIFCVIKELFAKQEPVDLVTVAACLEKKAQFESIGGAAYLSQISDQAPVAVNAASYAKIIRELSYLRQLALASNEVYAKCLENTESPDEIIEFAENSIFRITEKRTGNSIRSLTELLNQNMDQIETRQKNPGQLLGLSSGFHSIDQLTHGLQNKDLIILAARPSMGKTALALNIVRNVCLSSMKRVLFCSLEMGADQLSMRLLTSEIRMDSNRLKNGFLSNSDWNSCMDGCRFLSELPIAIDDSPNLSPLEIRAKARKLQQKHGDLGLIVIDYLQLMRGATKAERRDLEIAEISRSLKSIAKEMNIPIIALSQLNRSLENRQDKRPILSDLRESGAIEQDADIIMFIYRDEVYNKEADNPQKGIAEIIISKNRNGACGSTSLHFHGQYTRFEELTRDYREPLNNNEREDHSSDPGYNNLNGNEYYPPLEV